jgi:hypothetical protein
MTETQQTTFREVLASYLGAQGEPFADLREVSRARRLLPILADWTGFVGLDVDGTMTWIEYEEGRIPASADPGPLARHLAAIRGSEVFPRLSFLRPIVGGDWLLCPGCGGTGKASIQGQEAPEGVMCFCGGMGKIPPTLKEYFVVGAGP